MIGTVRWAALRPPLFSSFSQTPSHNARCCHKLLNLLDRVKVSLETRVTQSLKIESKNWVTQWIELLDPHWEAYISFCSIESKIWLESLKIESENATQWLDSESDVSYLFYPHWEAYAVMITFRFSKSKKRKKTTILPKTPGRDNAERGLSCLHLPQMN